MNQEGNKLGENNNRIRECFGCQTRGDRFKEGCFCQVKKEGVRERLTKFFNKPFTEDDFICKKCRQSAYRSSEKTLNVDLGFADETEANSDQNTNASDSTSSNMYNYDEINHETVDHKLIDQYERSEKLFPKSNSDSIYVKLPRTVVNKKNCIFCNKSYENSDI